MSAPARHRTPWPVAPCPITSLQHEQRDRRPTRTYWARAEYAKTVELRRRRLDFPCEEMRDCRRQRAIGPPYELSEDEGSPGREPKSVGRPVLGQCHADDDQEGGQHEPIVAPGPIMGESAPEVESTPRQRTTVADGAVGDIADKRYSRPPRRRVGPASGWRRRSGSGSTAARSSRRWQTQMSDGRDQEGDQRRPRQDTRGSASRWNPATARPRATRSNCFHHTVDAAGACTDARRSVLHHIGRDSRLRSPATFLQPAHEQDPG